MLNFLYLLTLTAFLYPDSALALADKPGCTGPDAEPSLQNSAYCQEDNPGPSVPSSSTTTPPTDPGTVPSSPIYLNKPGCVGPDAEQELQNSSFCNPGKADPTGNANTPPPPPAHHGPIADEKDFTVSYTAYFEFGSSFPYSPLTRKGSITCKTERGSKSWDFETPNYFKPNTESFNPGVGLLNTGNLQSCTVSFYANPFDTKPTSKDITHCVQGAKTSINLTQDKQGNINLECK